MMTQDEIIRMARETGFFINRDGEIESPLEEGYAIDEYLERFAALVAAHEREKQAEQDSGCSYCNNDLFTGTKCNNCGSIKQDHVAIVGEYDIRPLWDADLKIGDKLYTAPVQQVDLTDDEILEITKRFALGIAFPVDGVTTPEMFARAVIAADREKNK